MKKYPFIWPIICLIKNTRFETVGAQLDFLDVGLDIRCLQGEHSEQIIPRTSIYFETETNEKFCHRTLFQLLNDFINGIYRNLENFDFHSNGKDAFDSSNLF